MARIADLQREAEVLERVMRQALERRGWSVEEQPVLGSLRPDFLLSREPGEHFVVQIKATRRPVHFGTVAQVDSYARMAEQARGLAQVHGVLLSTGPVSSAARDAAARVGVTVLTSTDLQVESGDAEAVATEWARQINELTAAKGITTAESPSARGEAAERRIGIREHWPELAGFVLRPFERMGPAVARDVPDAPALVDRTSIGPLTVDRQNVSRREIVVRVTTPLEWAPGFLGLEVGDEPDSLTYLAAIFAYDMHGIAILRLRTAARRVAMRVATRPLEATALRAEHIPGIERSLSGLPPEAAMLWRSAAAEADVAEAVRRAIREVLGAG
jgi:hypothetical protein